MVVIIIQSIVEVKKINNYLDEYLKYIFNEKGIKEVKKVCKKIIKCKPVTGLNDYSKEILALAMEKRIIMSIEQNRQSRQSTSYWQHLKIAAPLIYQENNSLADYMDLVVKDLYIEVKRNKTLSEISDFYDQEIYNATKLFSNRLFSLPNGRKVSVRDLTIAISKTLNSESVLKKEYVIKQKTGNLKNTAAIAGLTTALAISMIFNQEKDKIELENANLIEKIDENKFYVNEYLI